MSRAGRGASRERGLRRSQPERDWFDARAKVDQEGRCRVCRRRPTRRPLHAAHIVGRTHDQPKQCGSCHGTGRLPWMNVGWASLTPCTHCDGRGEAAVLYVHPDSIVPLCPGCHTLYDDHELDVMSVLTVDEQARAVLDAGGIELARRRTAPLAYREVAQLVEGQLQAQEDAPSQQ